MEITPFVKIEIYIPPESLETISEALHQAGAGMIGAYDHCLSLTDVTGRWRPLDTANPYLGAKGQIFSGPEIKVDVKCAWENVQATLETIRKVHPYEEPVIHVIPLLNHLFE